MPALLYKMTSTGTFTSLHSFVSATDGANVGVLTLATDGNFYGETQQGGASNCGTIFKLTTAGVFSVLYTFDGTHGCTPGFT